MTIWVVPSLNALFSCNTTWPERLRLSRSLAIAGIHAAPGRPGAPPAPRHAPLRSDSIYSRQSEEPKTGCQREPTAPLALSSSERRDPAHFARLRPLRRPSRPKQHRDFHQTERRLTSYRSGDIAQARKKGGLKFLYRDPKALAHSPPVKHNRACRPSVTGRGRSFLSPIS